MNINFAYLRTMLLDSVCIAMLVFVSEAYAQTSALSPPPVQYNNAGVHSPGFLGQERLHMGGPVQGFYQPVLITGPRGVQIAMTYNGEFTPLKPLPNIVGLLIGNVYRFRISNFPILETQGIELYPTLEVIDRLYAPQGKEAQHPIVVEITIQDIKDAINGGVVTKVIYLENPNNPTPTINAPRGHQVSMDVSMNVNPVAVADALGRPVAILRIGGRIPIRTPEGLLTDEFQFGSPSFIDYNTGVPQPRKSITNFPVAGQTPAEPQKQQSVTPPKQDQGQFDKIEF